MQNDSRVSYVWYLCFNSTNCPSCPTLICQMKYRILRKVLNPIEKALSEKAPNPLEINSYKVAKRSLYISYASIVIAVIFGLIGIYYMRVSPTGEQISRLIKQDSTLLSVQIDAANLTIEADNMRKFDVLKNKFNQYNEITLLSTELEKFIYLYKLKKKGQALVLTQVVGERIRIIDEILRILKQMQDIDELIPSHGLGIKISKCQTGLLQYKMLYTDNLSIGGTVDTSLLGQKAFDTLMYNVIELVDVLMPNLQEGRNRTERNMREIDSVNEINRRISDSNSIKRLGKKP